MTRLLRKGQWQICRKKGVLASRSSFLIMHRCAQMKTNYGIDGMPLTRQWACVRADVEPAMCIACHATPPDEMVGFVKMLKWER